MKETKKFCKMGHVSTSNSFMDTVKEYAEMTTINGVVYVFDEKFSKLSQGQLNGRTSWGFLAQILVLVL